MATSEASAIRAQKVTFRFICSCIIELDEKWYTFADFFPN
jgi:hypothetical protein